MYCKILKSWQFDFLVLLVVIFLNIKVAADIPETSRTTITYYDVQLQWNDAHNFCQSKGGHLFKENSAVRKSVLSKLITFLDSSNYLKTNVWVALHDIYSNRSGQLYKWTDCRNLTDWNDFDTDEAFSEEKFCVSVVTNDLSWQITNCSEPLHVLCETNVPCSCTMDLATDESPKLSSTLSVTTNATSLSECKILCLEHVRGTDECWGLTFNNGDNTCLIHERMALQPYAYGTNLVFYAKICFQAAVITTADVDAHSTDPTSIPEAGCSEDDIIPTVAPCVYDISTYTPDRSAFYVSLPNVQYITMSMDHTTHEFSTETNNIETTTNVPSLSEATDVPSTTEATDVSSTTAATDISSTRESADVPSTTEATDVASTTEATDMSSTREPTDVPSTTEATDVPSTTEATDMSSTREPTDVPSTTEATDVPSTTEATDMSSATKAINTCNCACKKTPDISLQEQLDLLVRALAIDKKNTSAVRRRKYSAVDHRSSAKGIGYAGAFVLLFVSLGIVLLDVARLKVDVSKGLYNIRTFRVTRN